MRKYTVQVLPADDSLDYEYREVESNSRIRIVSVVMHYRIYGVWPSNYWAEDGFMALTWDDSGNMLTVSQENYRCKSSNEPCLPLALLPAHCEATR